MPWYMNFCAPFIPNDPVINFHRLIQTSELIILLVLYIILHTYYKMCHQQQKQEKSQTEQESSENYQKNSDYISDQSQNDKKSVSLKLDQKKQCENQSYIQFKKPPPHTKRTSKTKITDQYKSAKNIENLVTLEQVQQFFPIVYGHHAIAIAASVMYSPYAQQSIMALLYLILSILLIFFNNKRRNRATMFVWIIMCILNVCMLMSALLEVGQSNFDYVNGKCFAEQYISLY